MIRIVIILAVSATTYLTRLAGFRIGDRKLPVAVDRVLAWVPVASFAALSAPGIATGSGGIAARMMGAALAALIFIRLGPLWAGILAGMAGYWAVQFLVM